MRDFNFAIKNIKVILEAMQTDEFIERGSEYRRAKSKELQEVSKGEEKGKEQLTVNLEQTTSIFWLSSFIACKTRELEQVSYEAFS